MRILHVSLLWDTEGSILRQLESEITASSDLEESVWHVKCFTLGESNKDFITEVSVISIPFLSQLWLRVQAYYWVRNEAKKYDVVLFRYPFADPFQLLVHLGNSNICTVHHTKEIEELAVQETLSGKLKVFLEKYMGAWLLKKSKGIVAVTPEIGQYENHRIGKKLPVFFYPNGICVDKINIANDNRPSILQLVFVATVFREWHGLDRLLNSLLDNKDNFVLHIVGNVGDISGLKKSKDSRVVLHGFVSEEKLAELLSSADVGISSLGMDRNMLNEACPLKTREYFASGIAVYGNYNDPAFPKNFPYYKKGNADMSEIIQYAQEMRLVSHKEVRESARPYIDKKVVLRNLVHNISTTLGG